MKMIRTRIWPERTPRREPALLRAIVFLLSIVLAGPSFAHGPVEGSVGHARHEEAVALFRRGKFDEVFRLAGRVLSIYEKSHGPGHTHMADILNNLAWYYESQGAYQKAEPIYWRALAIQ